MSYETDDAEILAAARLGRAIDAERTGSPTVRLLLEMIDIEKDAAIVGFIEVNPSDAAKVAELQVKARAANLIGKWIIEAVERGRAAEQALSPPYEEPRD